MIYGYARVSTTDQNLDRQLAQLKEIVPDERNIICDKASGKNFDRKGYNLLVGTATTSAMLREGDLLVIISLDRLGRNYMEIQEQWRYITHTLKADIKVLDMPMLDTSQSTDNLDRRFIADLVLQILSYTAEKERENIRKRQRQGIDTAKANGKKFGRPSIEYPDNWQEVYTDWKAGLITATKAMEITGLKRNSFYKLANKYTAENSGKK
jgi:DNA invertase Pin-like site-specific DNA recombinase